MKLLQLINIRKVLAEHAHERMSVALAYKIMKLMKASDNEDAFYNAQIQKIAENYALKDENGHLTSNASGGIKIAPAHIKDCQNEVDILGQQEVESPEINFAINELSELKLSVAELYALDEIIKEG